MTPPLRKIQSSIQQSFLAAYFFDFSEDLPSKSVILNFELIISATVSYFIHALMVFTEFLVSVTSR